MITQNKSKRTLNQIRRMTMLLVAVLALPLMQPQVKIVTDTSAMPIALLWMRWSEQSNYCIKRANGITPKA